MAAPGVLRYWTVDSVIEAMDGVGDDLAHALMVAVPDAYKAGGVSMNVAWPRLDKDTRAKLKAVAEAYEEKWERLTREYIDGKDAGL